MGKFWVLLADDHAIVRDGLKQILADTEDLAVAGEASNGVEVMQRVREKDWDIVVLDISMPGYNGLELIRLIKEEKPNLPILILSMHREEEYAVRALRAGASGYLTKESDCTLLVAAVRRVAAGGVHISDKVSKLMSDGITFTDPLAPHKLLSEREHQVFKMLVKGLGVTEIATRLGLSAKTVSTHKTRILQKLNLTNYSDLLRYAIFHHLSSGN